MPGRVSEQLEPDAVAGLGSRRATVKRPREVELTALDVILVSSVLLALGLYNYWFLFEAGSPLDQRTGRE